jgi:acetyl-CoA carboxylase biotin carboxyl carrier protein
MHEVTAPMPGTFYRRSDPDADPYVEAGDTVAADDTIGLIEVMKQFTEVKAGADGTVEEFAADNEGSVKAGQVLATIDTDGAA